MPSRLETARSRAPTFASRLPARSTLQRRRLGPAPAAEAAPVPIHRRRDALAEENVELVSRAARQLRRRLPAHTDPDDLRGDGMLGLLDAADRYDPAQGEFEPYAWQRIVGAMLDGLRARDLVSRSARHRGAAAVVLSLDADPLRAARGEPAPSVLDTLTGPQGDDPADTVCTRETLADVLRLPQRERAAVLRSAAGATVAEVARDLGVSVDRAAKIRRRGLHRLGAAHGPTEAELTPIERQVLVGAALGEAVPETAERLGKGVETVKSQRKSVLRKLGARAITNAVYIATRDGLLDGVEAYDDAPSAEA